MTKKNKFLPFFLILIFVPLYLRWKHKEEPPLKMPKESPAKVASPLKIDLKKQEINGRKVLGLHPGHETEDLKKIKTMTNVESEEWEEKLEETLRDQGGEEILSVSVKKLSSLVLAQDDLAINVVSAIATVQNKKEETTTFRVLVDSETGKVLRNWDQPVVDPANPRENFGIKLDPRYHND